MATRLETREEREARWRAEVEERGWLDEDEAPDHIIWPDLDIREYKSKAGVAKAVARWLRDRLWADIAWHFREGLAYRGPDPKYVIVRGPNDPDETWARNQWHVIAEELTFQWAVYAEDGIDTGEGYGPGGPKIIGQYEGKYHLEPGWSFSVIVAEN